MNTVKPYRIRAVPTSKGRADVSEKWSGFYHFNLNDEFHLAFDLDPIESFIGLLCPLCGGSFEVVLLTRTYRCKKCLTVSAYHDGKPQTSFDYHAEEEEVLICRWMTYSMDPLEATLWAGLVLEELEKIREVSRIHFEKLGRLESRDEAVYFLAKSGFSSGKISLSAVR